MWGGLYECQYGDSAPFVHPMIMSQRSSRTATLFCIAACSATAYRAFRVTHARRGCGSQPMVVQPTVTPKLRHGLCQRHHRLRVQGLIV